MKGLDDNLLLDIQKGVMTVDMGLGAATHATVIIQNSTPGARGWHYLDNEMVRYPNPRYMWGASMGVTDLRKKMAEQQGGVVWVVMEKRTALSRHLDTLGSQQVDMITARDRWGFVAKRVRMSWIADYWEQHSGWARWGRGGTVFRQAWAQTTARDRWDMVTTYVKRVMLVHYLEQRVARRHATRARWARLRQAMVARSPRYWGRVEGARRIAHRHPEVVEVGEPVAIMGATRHEEGPGGEKMFIEHTFSLKWKGRGTRYESFKGH